MCSIKWEATVYISIPGDYFESDNLKLLVFEQQTTGTFNIDFLKSSNNMKINRTMLRRRKLSSRLKTDNICVESVHLGCPEIFDMSSHEDAVRKKELLDFRVSTCGKVQL